MKIKHLRLRPVAAPMKRPLTTSTGAVTVAALLLIDLETDAGVVGRSYLFALGKHNLPPIAKLVEAMSDMIKGDEVAPLELERKLRARYALLGVHNIVLFAMAGAVPRPIPAYNSKGLGIMPLAPLAKEADELVAEGFRAVKLRMGRAEARDDLEALRAVKQAIGPDIVLMVDFNQALTVAEAIRRGRLIDDEGGVYWIEEPIRADDFAGAARVAREVATPIQLGENFMGPEQMAQALAAGACDYVMPDAQRIGGVSGWLRAAALAQGAGAEMSSHLFPEVSCHLLAATPTCHWLEFVDWANPVLEQPAELKDGHVMIPSQPGSGIAWDEKAVARYAL
ncbi:MAG: mandelate racemase [Betaproteobacteria bacterium]|nr:MAG: mandelate racemase [Betaproteobacteria bacterium]